MSSCCAPAGPCWRVVEPRLAASGLTLTQFGVLEAILHKGPLSQRELSQKVLTSAGNMTDLVDKLEARGLVQRARQSRSSRCAGGTDTSRERPDRAAVRPHAGDIAARWLR